MIYTKLMYIYIFAHYFLLDEWIFKLISHIHNYINSYLYPKIIQVTLRGRVIILLTNFALTQNFNLSNDKYLKIN